MMGKRREVDRNIQKAFEHRNRDVAREPVIRDLAAIQREHERRTREQR